MVSVTFPGGGEEPVLAVTLTRSTPACITVSSRTSERASLDRRGSRTRSRSGRCLNLTGADTADGTAVELWTGDGDSNQKWTARGRTTAPAGRCFRRAQWWTGSRSRPPGPR
ncbi:RICIN domain-containing protein [Amycolatopsis sp. NPDC049252]|uniref:RICIN domain-containing protein n=1 Tax=Amycolatopsis sp. NPDC049252 TaxID=3363933 RepID=UPI003717B9DD